MGTPPNKAQAAAAAAEAGLDPLLLDLSAVIALTGIGQRRLYELMEADRFPRPRKASDRIARWYRPELVSWIEKLPVAEYGLTKRGQLPRDPMTTGLGRKWSAASTATATA
jgi:predicted DNA-binding transcriptional regulator AlpA